MGAGLQVLVVTSSAPLLGRLAARLAEHPEVMVVIKAGVPGAAEAWTLAGRFDAVVVDVDCGAPGGMEEVGPLRRAVGAAALVALTLDESPELRWRCLELGADAVLSKASSEARQVDAVLEAARRGGR